MRKFLILLWFFSVSFGSIYGQEFYYWAYGEKYPLELYPEKHYVVVETDSKQAISQGLKIAQVKVEEIQVSSLTQAINRSNNNSSDNHIKWTVVSDRLSKAQLNNSKDIIYSAPFFKVNGKELGLSNYFYVKLKKASDIILLEEMAKENKIEIIGNDSFMPLWYVLSCSKISNGNALVMANLFYESGSFEEAQPIQC